MAPGRAFDCNCFTCTDGGRAGPKRVSRSTLYDHRKHKKRRRLDLVVDPALKANGV